ISPDGKQITIKSAGATQPVLVTLNDESTIRKLPPDMALRLAMVLNPTYKPAQAGADSGNARQPGGNAAGAPPYGAKAGEAAGATPANGPWPGAAGGARAGRGDFAQMIENAPKISVSDLKTGDAVIVSGAATAPDNSRLQAANIIAGAEPILRAAPSRSGQSQNADWNLGMDAPAQQ
ncbi:MAG: hypothetical protein JO145_13165, partial [Acidobacteriaceae bacterium]|nr:hypothetical protein [Acidobacteriaceae bacterium]